MTRFEIATFLLRGTHLAAVLSLFGSLVFRQFVVPVPEVAWRAVVTRVGSISAAVALVFGGVWLTAVAGTIAGASSVRTMLAAVPLVAHYTGFGNLVCARLLLLAVVLLLLSRRHRYAPVAALLAAGIALALQPLLGHIGALEGDARLVLIPIEAAHLLAAGAWLGGLVPLLLCVVRAPPKLAANLCERFTPVGLVAVGTIAVTALPQAGELIGGLPGLIGTQYGHLAAIKIGLFVLALGLACANRLVLTERLAAGAGRRGLIVSVAIETVAVSCVVLAAAAMASSAPAEHIQPVWPFAWRPSLVAWEEPELRGELTRLLIACGCGVALVCTSLILRRFRIVAVVIAMAVMAPFMPSLSLLLVEAFPTSYARSPTGFSVGAIVDGGTLFNERCAVCHVPQNGTGSAADLTAPHMWGHLDGELFWWITNGVADPEGAALMPAFGPVLSEDDRWALIDFIRARNIGVQVSKTGTWSPPVPAPSTPLSCAGPEVDSLLDLSTHVLLVAAGAGTMVPDETSGAVTITLSRGAAEKPAEGECVSASTSAWDAWAVLAGVSPDNFAGYRAVVDGQGWLRAWLPPGTALEQALAAIRDARDHPIASGARPGGGHHH
jgi:putative copper export protein/mono/diheme cytochrome c family protein